MVEETVGIVIPAKNEAETIGEAIDRTREAASDYFDDVVVVVPSSSTDGTDSIAREHGAEVIRDGGRGLGEAMFRGLKRAAAQDVDYILTIDADLQFQPGEASRLIEAREEADLVLGSRFMDDGIAYRMSLSHRIGNRILTGLLNHLAGLPVTDGQTGYRLMRREVAEALRMVGRHTYVQETIIDAHQNGFTVTEVPVTFAERQEGGSRVVSSIPRYALRTLPVILHRTGLTTILLNGAGLAAAVLSLAVIAVAATTTDLTLGILGALMLLLGVQGLFLGMLLDGDPP